MKKWQLIIEKDSPLKSSLDLEFVESLHDKISSKLSAPMTKR